MKISTGDVDIALLLFLFFRCWFRDQLFQELLLIVHLNPSVSLGLRSLRNGTCSSCSVLNIKHLHLNDVEEETEDGNYKHDTSYDRLGSNDSQGGLIEEPNGEDPNCEDRDDGSHNLSSVITVGHVVVGWFL